MIGIREIAIYIPAQFESNYDKKERFGVDDHYIENKIGVIKKARKSDDEDTSDMCCRAYEALTAKTEFSANEIDCLVVCTQNPDGYGLPHTSAIVHGKLGLPETVAAFDISLGCSGYVYSLSVVTAFIQANGLKQGLLFTADPYSKVVDPNDKSTSMIFGDAATVTLLTADPALVIEKSLFNTRGKEHQNLQCNDNILFMNGRAIFNFSMTAVPIQIKALLEETGYHLEEIDLIVTHQASKFLLDTLARRMKVDPQKMPSNLTNLGNTISSSIPILLEDYVHQSDFNRILVSGFGVGLSWASAILTRPETN